ncbi:MAG: class I SAM-dependent methyltransferase [Rhodospirillales bacterium]|nr:class I SAM-dependent methyltransferase [Rhodospirillales bacterium]
MKLEENALLRHDHLSGEWSDRYYAGRFPRNMDEYDIWKRHRLYLEFLERIGPLGSALEVGCGTGDNIAKCTAAVRLGIDVSERMIKNAGQVHKDIEFSVMDILDGSLTTVYDVVICLGVIQYVSDHRRFLDAVVERVADNGYLVLSFPNKNSLFRQMHYLGGGTAGKQKDHLKDEICGLLEERGFIAERLRAHSSALPGTSRLLAPFNLLATFALDGWYSVIGDGALADRLAYSYLGLFRKS